MAGTDPERCMSTTTLGRLRRTYEDALWGTMDALGVNESIERKVFVAVGLQFAVSVAQLVLPFAVSGLAWYLLAGLLFVAAVVAFGNSVLITRRGGKQKRGLARRDVLYCHDFVGRPEWEPRSPRLRRRFEGSLQ